MPSKNKLATQKYRYSPLTRYGRFLLRKVNKAFRDFSIIGDDDRVCVALSGGKDSLSLLSLLLEHKRFYNSGFTVTAAHVVSDFNPRAHEIADYLESHCAALGVELTRIPVSVTTDEEGNHAEPSCFWCSWKRRQVLFRHCADGDCSVLAFGHHSDDAAETSLLNLVYHGNLQTILPARTFFDGKFRVVRPLIFIRERELVKYAELAGFSTSTCSCPNDDHGKRRVMKDLLRSLQKEAKQVNVNLWRASLRWHEAIEDRPCHPQPRPKEADDGVSER